MRIRERAVVDGTVRSRCLLVLMLYLCCFCGVLGELNGPILRTTQRSGGESVRRRSAWKNWSGRGISDPRYTSGFTAVILSVKRVEGEGVRLRVREGEGGLKVGVGVSVLMCVCVCCVCVCTCVCVGVHVVVSCLY